MSEEKWKEVVSTFRGQTFRNFGDMKPKEMEQLLRDHVCTAIGEHCEEKKKGEERKKGMPKIYKRLYKKKKKISRRYNDQNLDLTVEERNKLKERIRVVEQQIRRHK